MLSLSDWSFRCLALVALIAIALLNTTILPTSASQLQAANFPNDYFSLPWKPGISWAFTTGPHGPEKMPPSALDFGVGQVPDKDDARIVRAVAPGTIRLVPGCPDWVIIKHDNGWSTGYAHMENISTYFPKDKRVLRGQPIGKAASSVSKCDDRSTGAHLHIWFMDTKDNNVDATGLIIGGWRVENNRLVSVKDSSNVVKQGGWVSNDGTIGTQPPAPPSYIITAANSEKCLDVDNWGKHNGANVWQWKCHSGVNQQWRKETLPNGYLRLINVNSKKCLDVANQSRDNGANIHQWECHDGDSQQWWPIELKGSPFYIIKNRRSDKCLDVSGESTADGGNVQQWDCHGRNNQQWAFSAPDSTPPKATQPAPQQPKPEPAPQPPVPGTTPPQPSVPGQLPPAQQPPARPVLTYIKVYKSGANVYGNFCIDADGYTLQWGSVGRWDSGAPRSNGAINGCRTGVWFFADVTDARETLWVQIVAKAGSLERTYKIAIGNAGGNCQLEANDTPLREPTECTFTNA